MINFDTINFEQFISTLSPALLSWEQLGIKHISPTLSNETLDNLRKLNKLLHITDEDRLKTAFVELVYKEKIPLHVLLDLTTLSSYSCSSIQGLYSTINIKHSTKTLSEDELIFFFDNSGLKEIFKNHYITDLVSFCIGTLIGIKGSNCRKNSTGKKMELVCFDILSDFCRENNFKLITQANIKKINLEFNLKLAPTSRRIFDFVIKKTNGQLVFIETNYYSTQGSKIKACCNEYISLSKRLTSENHTFIWLTDGDGWRGSKTALKEAFDSIPYIINFNMINKGAFDYIFEKEKRN